MDRLKKRFLWEENSLTHKFSLIKWKSGTQPNTRGGLGIKNRKFHNNNLLMKCLRMSGELSLSSGETSSWLGMAFKIFGVQRKTLNPHGVRVRKHVSSFQDDFFREVSFKASNVIKIRFWQDKWLGNSMLKDYFPSLFLIASEKEATISQYRDNNYWTPIF